MKEMRYSSFAELYEDLDGTTKRLEKVSILAEFIKKLHSQGNTAWIYLVRGKVVPDYDPREIGISHQLALQSISTGLGIKSEEIVKRYRTIGDLGLIAEEFTKKKKQSVLFHKELTVKKVFDNLHKVMDIEGKGAVSRKIGLVAELLGAATEKEAKYIVRTLLGDLRIGVADGIVRDSITEAYFAQDKNEMAREVEQAYDLSNDFALVLNAAAKGKNALRKIDIVPGRPLHVMLPVKVEAMSEAFRICGKPAAIEHKYDGFRMVISNYKKKITLFTRRLENVTAQFPDVVNAVHQHVRGENFMLDSEVVGYDPATGKYKPFEAISQRIRRKYDISKLERDLPVEINVFDVLYHNDTSMLSTPFKDRRKLLEKIVKPKKLVIRPSLLFVTDDEKKAEQFYKDALKQGEEGIMMKKLNASYQAGRRVGYMVKLKPTANDLDLAIVGAEYGSGKRAGWLTSFIVACRSGNEFLEVGKVSSGLKEKVEEGTTYEEMTSLLQGLIISTKGKEVKVKPKIIVSVTYQNIQPSPSYSSGFAMRFPRITHYRPDRHTGDIATLKDIEKEVREMQRKKR